MDLDNINSKTRSRIGKAPIILPEKVKATVTASSVKIEGPKGSLEKSFNPLVNISLKDDRIVVHPKSDSRLARALHGTVRALINNMVQGVVNGFIENLEIQGAGFKAAMTGSDLTLNLGYSHIIKYPIPAGVVVTVTDNTKLNIAGLDKQLIGQVAARIYHFYKVEPYKGKGVRYTNRPVRTKEGKKSS
jgi:large subunit ribosomal protein L6